MQRRTAAVGSAIFFVLAPGAVAGLVPYLLTGGWSQDPASWWLRACGLFLVLAGLPVLVHSFARFVSEGVGTPAPVAPTDRLVIGGLYRYVRNPMYVAVLSLILGQVLWFASLSLLIYAIAVWLAFAIFVKIYEEPTLSRTFGEQYADYRRHVRAWWPRIRPWVPLQ